MAGPKPGLLVLVSRFPPFKLRRGREAGTAFDLIAARLASLCVSRPMAVTLVDGECRKILVLVLVRFLQSRFWREVVVADHVLVLPVVIENDKLELCLFFHIVPPSFSVVSC